MVELPTKAEKPEIKPVEKPKEPEKSKIPVAKPKQPENKAGVKPEPQPEAKPEVKPEVKPVATPVATPEVKPEIKPEVKSEEEPVVPVAPERVHKKPSGDEKKPIETIPFKPAIFEKPEVEREIQPDVRRPSTPSTVIKPQLSIRSESPIQKGRFQTKISNLTFQILNFWGEKFEIH